MRAVLLFTLLLVSCKPIPDMEVIHDLQARTANGEARVTNLEHRLDELCRCLVGQMTVDDHDLRMGILACVAVSR